MSFPFNVYWVAVVSAWAVSAAALPLWRWWCCRTGLVDDPGHRKIHSQPVPLAGGLAVMTGMLIPMLVGVLALWWQAASGKISLSAVMDAPPGSARAPVPLAGHGPLLLLYGLHRRGIELGTILLGALGMLVVGWWDDKRELNPRAKFLGQLLIAALVAAGGTQITLFIHSTVFHYAITILWILTVVNAFNFMDNMNGLCAGLGAIGTWYFAVLAAAAGQYLVAILAFLTFGALLGFLPYNFPRASAFLGDAGSHLVGYLMAVLAILPHFYTSQNPRRWAVLIPLLVLAVPLLDMASVVIIRWRNGKPFYLGDNNHLSHRLVRAGLSRTRAVALIWLLAALTGGLICCW